MVQRRCERRVVALPREQRDELLQVRERHPKPYVRERAATVTMLAAERICCSASDRGLRAGQLHLQPASMWSK
jgi:hypothetical protein